MKQQKQESKEYYSWDYYQRLVKNNAKINQSPLIKEKIESLMAKIEEYLDGPNKDFDQKQYLKDKEELQKLIESLDYPERIKKAS